MLPNRTLEQLIRAAPPEHQDIVIELRSLIAQVAPTVTEKTQGCGFTYYFAERGGTVSAGLCQIFLLPDHVRLAFIHGAFLPDPKHLLEGKTYPKRYVQLTRYDHVPWDDLRDLIEASSRFDPYTQQFR